MYNHCVHIVIVILTLASNSFCAKILLPVFRGDKHVTTMKTIADELKTRGHQVTLLVPDYIKEISGSPDVMSYPTSQSPVLSAQVQTNMSQWNKMVVFQQLAKVQEETCEHLLKHDQLKDQYKEFDMIVTDALFLCGPILAAKFKKPYISILLDGLNFPCLDTLGFGIPLAYVPQLFSEFRSEMTFVERVFNTMHYTIAKPVCWWYWYRSHDALIDRFDAGERGIVELLGDVSLVIVQSDFALEIAQPLPPNVKLVGALFPKFPEPLSPDIEEWISSSGTEGVVLVSFGSTILSDSQQQAVVRSLAKIPLKVVWKTTGNIAFRLGNNTRVLPWIPLNDLLAHPSTRAFVTHAERAGISEAAYHGVPMVTCALFGEQFDISARLQEKGVAVGVDMYDVDRLETNLEEALNKVVTDTSFKTRILHVSKILKNRVRTPTEEATDWIEYVLKVGDMEYLRPLGNNMFFYQHYLLDVFACLIITTTVVFRLVFGLVTLILEISMACLRKILRKLKKE